MPTFDKDDARQGKNKPMVNETLVVSLGLAVTALLILLLFYVL